MRKYSETNPIIPIDFKPLEVDKVDLADKKSSTDLLLDMIFEVDPRTKLPRGDISQYLGKETADDVRKFIEKSLLNDHKGYDSVDKLNKEYSNLSEDFIVGMMRKDNESKEDYLERMSNFVEDTRRRTQYERYARRDS